MEASPETAGPTEEEIEHLVEERRQAKARRDYAEADRIRQALAAEGIVLKDSPTGTTWERG